MGLAAGTCEGANRKQWSDFRKEYESTIAAGMEPGSRQETFGALNHFERIVKPRRVDAITAKAIDQYKQQRRTERGRKKKSTVSPATINKELRHIRAVLRIAHEWKYLPQAPKVRMLREPEKLVTYVTPEHFAAIYQACDTAVRPKGLPYSPADWWQALIVFAYMTGWRVGEPLALRWDDVSLDDGQAMTRREDNKGKRDDVVPLHPVVVDHLRRIVDASVDFGPMVFPWPHGRTTLWADFAQIQEAAGIHLPCREKHEHTPRCHVYGFHDLRRAFATVNAETMTADALQALMRHKS